MTTKDFKEVLNRLVGTSNVLSNNVLFIDFCDGSHGKAQFLSQLFYWQGRTTRKDGFFFKTYDEWHKEIRLPKHSVVRYANSFKESGFLKTKILKANGFPTVHYQLDTDKLITLLVAFCNKGSEQIATNVSYNLQHSKDSDNLQHSSNIEYQRTQTENTKQTPNGDPDKFNGFNHIAKFKERVGKKQHDLLYKLCSTDEDFYQLLRDSYIYDADVKDKRRYDKFTIPGGRFELFVEFLEYRNEIKKPFNAKSGIKTLYLKKFSLVTFDKLRSSIDEMKSNGWQSIHHHEERKGFVGQPKHDAPIRNLPAYQRRQID